MTPKEAWKETLRIAERSQIGDPEAITTLEAFFQTDPVEELDRLRTENKNLQAKLIELGKDNDRVRAGNQRFIQLLTQIGTLCRWKDRLAFHIQEASDDLGQILQICEFETKIQFKVE